MLLALFTVWFVKQLAYPTFDRCDACEGTGVLSCGAFDCVHGKVRCTATCLKADDPGWLEMNFPDQLPGQKWLCMWNDDGGQTCFSNAHNIGFLVQKVDGKWAKIGLCPVCHGTGRMPCPVCHGQKTCPTCDGSGRVRRWGLW